MDAAELKREAARRAVEFVESGMVVGLGGGSTAAFAVERIGQLLHEGQLKDVLGIPCALEVARHAEKSGVPLTALEEHPVIDLTIDGADEVDPQLNLIKGGGGALLREKIVAQASRREIIVVDESKLSPVLGTKWAVPVEVIEFGWRTQADYLQSLGAEVSLRKARNGALYRTDEGNLILDAHFGPIQDLEALATHLQARAGIVEHGLFLQMADDLIVAGAGGVRHTRKAIRR